MALTAARIEQRRGKLTASRIACLMTSDEAAIFRLWQEMIGEAQPDSLDEIWAAQLGLATEDLNLRWFEKKNSPLSRRGEFVIHPQYPWAAGTLDAWCDQLKCPVEAKHVGGREPLEVVIDRYAPQTQWQMECTGAEQCALSIIVGANEPLLEFVERDADYADEMIVRGRQFMRFVEQRKPPVVLPPVPPPITADKSYDMTGNNLWASSAAVWRTTRATALACDEAGKILKSIVPADALKCFGHGVRITRDRAGRLSLREDQHG